MSDDLFQPYDKLIRLVVLGKLFEVPENNLLLRQLQHVAPDIATGRYCWNGECRYCEVNYRLAPEGPEFTGLACLIKGVVGMRLTRLALEVRYNMSDALAAAPREDAPSSSS